MYDTVAIASGKRINGYGLYINIAVRVRISGNAMSGSSTVSPSADHLVSLAEATSVGFTSGVPGVEFVPVVWG
jgi:hypothetical protein